MESLRSCRDHLKQSHSRAKKLVETGLALDALFAGEETRLRRENEASRLRAVRRSIVEQLQWLRGIEASASAAHTEVNMMRSVVGLAVTAVVSTSKPLTAFVGRLFDRLNDREKPFGLVMVRVGPNGLPDDVGVVSISQLARQSDRPQPEIVSRLQEEGYLLFSGEAFQFLIDRLLDDVREGKLRLPVSRDELVEAAGADRQGLSLKVTRIE